MNRVIKFRGKRVDNGEWVYGFYVNLFADNVNTAYILTGKSDVRWGSGTAWETFDKHEVDPSTIGQFTGLTDKNGNEIWEGDILRSWTVNSPVTYDNGTFMWENEPLAYDLGVDTMLYPPSEWAKVTGNIHEKKSNEF